MGVALKSIPDDTIVLTFCGKVLGVGQAKLDLTVGEGWVEAG